MMQFYEVRVTEYWNGCLGDEFSSVIKSKFYKDETLARLKLNKFKLEYKKEPKSSEWFTFELLTLNTED